MEHPLRKIGNLQGGKEKSPMKTVLFCMIISLLFAFPISGKTAILKNNMALKVKSPNITDKEIHVKNGVIKNGVRS
jgi:hypothetical protein